MQFAADVLACNRKSDDDMEVLDTWNIESGRNNIPDETMDTFPFSMSIEDGRIKCRYGFLEYIDKQ